MKHRYEEKKVKNRKFLTTKKQTNEYKVKRRDEKNSLDEIKILSNGTFRQEKNYSDLSYTIVPLCSGINELLVGEINNELLKQYM